jgi:hypothetical protein
MKKLVVSLAVGALSTALAFAQASGSFNAAGTNAACAIGAGGEFSGGAGVNLLTTTVQTSNGQGVTLLIRPSLVTGLFTDTKITTTVPSASADIGIQVCLTIDGSTDGILSSPCVVYDQRFQQISTNLFSTITECAAATEECNFDLILSTLSAHSYDFVAQVPNGSHTITSTWSVIGQETAGNPNNARTASCVGPGVLTVTQTKVFKQNGTLTF